MKGQLILNNPDKVYNTIKSLQATQYIDPLQLTVKDIEDFCRTSSLNLSNQTKDHYVERKCKPPLMAAYFYYYLYYYEKVPNQSEFRSFYARLNFQWIAKHIGQRYRKAFDARLDRFYASIMRDLHFYHLAKEHLPHPIEFTLENDIEKKLDLLVLDEEKFGIQLRVNTIDSTNYACEKENRTHEKRSDIHFIDFPLNMRKAKQVQTQQDVFYFYDKFHIEELKEKMKDTQSA